MHPSLSFLRQAYCQMLLLASVLHASFTQLHRVTVKLKDTFTVRMNCCPRISTNKDRGYAWWILFMSFLSHVCNRGFSFGILGNMTIAHQKFFNIGLQESGIIGSLHVASIFIFAPLASIMVKKLGCRTVEILGGCCLILGFGLSSLSTQSWHAFMLFSLLAAYFQRFSYFAFSLAILGTFIGSTVWPIGSQYLLDTFGYSKAMGFMAISHLIHFIAGASFIPPNNTQQSSEGTRLLK
ncbi:hypothetical protein EB796_016754 [Bugula neritina]|uniref:Uncharacterized protein n=1 Tax=Bugula neritina TaxID=10212 RepID=A0A7J7JFU0_BUGNE|nr:hypothetical protein EB796_016754 [Bugula neritina]